MTFLSNSIFLSLSSRIFSSFSVKDLWAYPSKLVDESKLWPRGGDRFGDLDIDEYYLHKKGTKLLILFLADLHNKDFKFLLVWEVTFANVKIPAFLWPVSAERLTSITGKRNILASSYVRQKQSSPRMLVHYLQKLLHKGDEIWHPTIKTDSWALIRVMHMN